MKTEAGGGSWWSKAGIDPFKYVGRDEGRAEDAVREGFTAKARRHLRNCARLRRASNRLAQRAVLRRGRSAPRTR